ncbi:unnamed protein product [Rotaria sp. Silwood2]|nr:unnamed protein product [Rotaria sp. Silwood2]
MSLAFLKDQVGKSFGMSPDSFEIQIYDECFKDMCVLDDNYLEDLHEQLPLTSISEFKGDILRNHFPSIVYDHDQCKEITQLNDCSRALLFECNTIDNDNTASEEFNMIFPDDNQCSCPAELFISRSTEEIADVCECNECNYSTSHAQPLSDINQLNLLSSNDDIKKTICESDVSIVQRTPETLFSSDNDELRFTESMNLVTQEAVQDITDITVNKSVNINTIPVITPCTSVCENNSDGLALNIHYQTAQATVPKELSTSLQFIRDVHPHQKTQHDKDTFDKLIDKSSLSYVMRIQGFKTKADKGRSVLPRLKIPMFYISKYKRLLQPIHLMVAVVREEKINNKRNWHLCRDMQFLPANKNKITEAVNPIQLNLNSLSIESDGTFLLSLRLINIPVLTTTNKSDDKFFYQLDEETVKNLHHAQYDPNFIRLMCILVLNHKVAWNTLCLSDYIRPKQELQT